jgi:4-hydroxybenzoate polyprenyltransferase
MISLATKLSLRLGGGSDAGVLAGGPVSVAAESDAVRAGLHRDLVPRAFAEGDLPLVVDADGTLIRSDLMGEAIFTLLSHHPIRAIRALATICHGKTALRARLAAESSSGFAPIGLDVAPLDQQIVALLRRAKAGGRKIYLVSAFDRRCLDPLVARLGLFDGVFAGDGAANSYGSARADVLREAFGEGGFDYVGNADSEMAICRCAHEAVIVGATPRALRHAQRDVPHLQGLALRKAKLTDYIRALRVHQWLKNLLIPIPALAAHQFGPSTIGPLLLAFFAFSLFASSAYLLNDLLDLGNDRRHAIKRKRPFAAGAIPLGRGVLMVLALLAIAIGLALFLPARFMALLAGYYVLTLAYSLRLKREMMVDVLMLACLYGMRLVAGGAAVFVPLSPWLIAFSIFLFLSLAIVKRCTELIGGFEPGGDAPSGRGYQLRDMPVLEAMAVASGYVAALVFALYINSPPVMMLYRAPELLWLICVVLIHWISRVVMLTHRGEMHSDPIVFAATDPGSLISAVAIGAVVLVSI